MRGNTYIFMFCGNLYFLFLIVNITLNVIINKNKTNNALLQKADLSKFKLEDCFICEEIAVHKMYFFIYPKKFNPGLQLVDINMTLPVPIGNDAMLKVLFEINTQLGNKHAWIHLLDMEGDFCKMEDRYVGEVWYDVQRALGIMPHSCPLPRGTYHAVNYTMDYEKLKFQTFPFGKIRIKIHVYLKARPEIQVCFKFIVSNG